MAIQEMDLRVTQHVRLLATVAPDECYRLCYEFEVTRRCGSGVYAEWISHISLAGCLQENRYRRVTVGVGVDSVRKRTSQNHDGYSLFLKPDMNKGKLGGG